MTKIRFDKLIISLSTAVAEENILDKEKLHHMQMFLMLIYWLRNTTEPQETQRMNLSSSLGLTCGSRMIDTLAP
jgi:hypothetical protein